MKPGRYYLTDQPGSKAAMCDGRGQILEFTSRDEAERYLHFIGAVYNVGLVVFEAKP